MTFVNNLNINERFNHRTEGKQGLETSKRIEWNQWIAILNPLPSWMNWCARNASLRSFFYVTRLPKKIRANNQRFSPPPLLRTCINFLALNLLHHAKHLLHKRLRETGLFALLISYRAGTLLLIKHATKILKIIARFTKTWKFQGSHLFDDAQMFCFLPLRILCLQPWWRKP